MDRLVNELHQTARLHPDADGFYEIDNPEEVIASILAIYQEEQRWAMFEAVRTSCYSQELR